MNKHASIRTFSLPTANIATTDNTIIGTLSDDIDIISADQSQPKAVENLQRALKKNEYIDNGLEIRLNQFTQHLR